MNSDERAGARRGNAGVSADAAYWDRKFRARPDDLVLPPEPFLLEALGFLAPGRVLDLACGDGRNALYLAERGFRVLGVDFSPAALARLARLAARKDLRIELRQLDLEKPENLSGLGIFDDIVISHYRPPAEVFRALPRYLRTGGILLLCAFGHQEATLGRLPQTVCLAKDEFVDVAPELELLRHSAFADERGSLDGYVFRRR